jgi:hypothetical protein
MSLSLSCSQIAGSWRNFISKYFSLLVCYLYDNILGFDIILSVNAKFWAKIPDKSCSLCCGSGYYQVQYFGSVGSVSFWASRIR